MNKLPIITVVTVCFNAVKEIEKTMLSVLNQTYPNVEYIVIDGGSTDGTVDIIKKYANRLAYWVSEPDGGIYFGMNKGIARATGEWINFMNAGDVFFDKDVIANVFYQPYKSEIRALYGNVYKSTPKGLRFVPAMPVHNISKTMPCCHQAEFVKARNKDDIFFRAKQFRLAADYDVLYRLSYKYGNNTILKIDENIAIFDGNGVSTTKKRLVFREDIEIRKYHKDIRWYYDAFKDSIKKVLFKD